MLARASGGAAPRTPAPSAEAIAAQMRQRLGRRLPEDKTFRSELRHRMNIVPFRGTVTHINRDATGTNQVKVQRTGQTHEDATWYHVFAPKTVPIVGDEVLLEYVGDAPTAMVTQTRKGGRPDEQDIPYATGSMRRYDASRKLTQKHGDDHHSRHYRTDGVTIALLRSEAGHLMQLGDHIQMYTGTITEGAGTDGAYHKGTVSGTRHRRVQNLNDGSAERLLRELDATIGHLLYDAAPTSPAVKHAHLTSGHAKHSGDAYHNAALDSSGGHSGQWVRGTVAAGAYQKSMNISGAETVLHTHDGATQTVFSGSAWAIKHALVGGSGGQVTIRQFGSPSAGHLFGDNGGGKPSIKHAAGNWVLDHDNTTIQLYAGGGVRIKHDGSVHTVFSGGNTALSHTGSALSVFSGAQLSHILQLVGGSAGQILINQFGSTTARHLVGDGADGHLTATSQSGSMYVRLSAGASSYQHQQDRFTTAGGQYLNHPHTDASRLDVFSGSGGGALKAASHSITSVIAVQGPYTIAASPGNNFANLGAAAPSGGSVSPSNYFAKIQSICVYDSSHVNPGVYVHGGFHGQFNGGNGTQVYQAGSKSGLAGWTAIEANADSSLVLYGVANNGGSTFGVNIAVQTQIINV